MYNSLATDAISRIAESPEHSSCARRRCRACRVLVAVQKGGKHLLQAGRMSRIMKDCQVG